MFLQDLVSVMLTSSSRLSLLHSGWTVFQAQHLSYLIYLPETHYTATPAAAAPNSCLKCTSSAHPSDINLRTAFLQKVFLSSRQGQIFPLHYLSAHCTLSSLNLSVWKYLFYWLLLFNTPTITLGISVAFYCFYTISNSDR